MGSSPPRTVGPRRFLVRADPAGLRVGDPVELAPGESEHGARVLRLAPGDGALGLDGRGARLRLEVERADRKQLSVRLAAPVEYVPAPGEPGAELPRIELAVCWPKRARGEGMIDRLVQLGAARIAPVLAERTPPGSETVNFDRLRRIAGEALKQCAGAWLPELDGPRTLGAELDRETPARTFVLDPRAEAGLHELLAGDSVGRSVRFLIGPEGGFTPAELDTLLAGGARPARLTGRILRIETAAEAACGLAGNLLADRDGRARSPDGPQPTG